MTKIIRNGCAGIISASHIWINCNMPTPFEPSSRLLKLRPDYADGHINVGLTYIEWEKYSEARPALETALKLSPAMRARCITWRWWNAGKVIAIRK